MWYTSWEWLLILGIAFAIWAVALLLDGDPPPPPEPPTYTYEECIRNAEICLDNASKAWSTQLSQYYAQKATAWSELAKAKLEALQHQP